MIVFISYINVVLKIVFVNVLLNVMSVFAYYNYQHYTNENHDFEKKTFFTQKLWFSTHVFDYESETKSEYCFYVTFNSNLLVVTVS